MERGRRGGSNLAVVKGEGRAADSSPSGSCIGITPTRYHVPSRPPLAEPFTLPSPSPRFPRSTRLRAAFIRL